MKYATVVVSVLIIIAVLIPGPNLPDVSIGGFDKLIHILMFGAWALAVCFDYRSRALKFWIVFLAGIIFSLLTEVLQLMIEGRSFDVYDMVADGVGLLIGWLSSKMLIPFYERYIGSRRR
jgi:VanZ family protein